MALSFHDVRVFHAFELCHAPSRDGTYVICGRQQPWAYRTLPSVPQSDILVVHWSKNFSFTCLYIDHSFMGRVVILRFLLGGINSLCMYVCMYILCFFDVSIVSCEWRGCPFWSFRCDGLTNERVSLFFLCLLWVPFALCSLSWEIWLLSLRMRWLEILAIFSLIIFISFLLRVDFYWIGRVDRGRHMKLVELF